MVVHARLGVVLDSIFGGLEVMVVWMVRLGWVSGVVLLLLASVVLLVDGRKLYWRYSRSVGGGGVSIV